MASRKWRRLAQGLLADLDARTPGRSFPSYPDLRSPEAYEVQHEVTRLRERRGERVIGYKVGCTSRTIREQLGVGQPVFGRLFDTGCLRSGVRLAHRAYARLAIEGELAVRLSRDLSGGVGSAEEAREAIASVFPVIELHHYVFPGGWSPGAWLVVSNGLHAGFVCADEVKRRPDLSDFRHRLTIRSDGEAVDAFVDSGTVPGAVGSLCWLAGRLAESGFRLTAGQIVLTGSPMKLYPISPGSRISVDAGVLGQCCVEVSP